MDLSFLDGGARESVKLLFAKTGNSRLLESGEFDKITTKLSPENYQIACQHLSGEEIQRISKKKSQNELYSCLVSGISTTNESVII